MSSRNIERSEALYEIIVNTTLDIICAMATSVESQTMLVRTSLIVELHIWRIREVTQTDILQNILCNFASPMVEKW